MDDDFTPFSITAYYIFQECFKKAGLMELKSGVLKKKNWSLTLRAKLVEYLINYVEQHPKLKILDVKEKNAYLEERLGHIRGEYKSYEGYLRDTFRGIRIVLNGEPFGDKPYLEQLTYKITKFEPLLLYAGIENYKEIDNSFEQSFRDDKIPSKFLIEIVKYAITEPGKVINEPLINFEKLPAQWLAPKEDVIEHIEHKQIDEYALNEKQNNKASDFVIPGTQVEAETWADYPITIPVVYLKKPVKWFNLLPIPDEGELVFDENGNCVYNKDGRSMPIKKDTIKKDVKTFANPRDLEPLWVEVTYLDGEKPQTAYFAEPQDDAYKLKLADPGRLLKLFNTKKKTEVSG